VQVHQVKTRYSNSYVVEDAEAIFVVDVAYNCDGTVLQFIEQMLNRSVEDVRLIACTHDDPDHIGGVYPMAKACKAKIALPHAARRRKLKLYRNPMGPLVKFATSAREAFRSRTRYMYMNPERNARYEHVPNRHLLSPEAELFDPPGHRLTEGKQLEGFPDWKIIHTPGHSWDSICFFHGASGSLITGDTLLGSKSKGQLVHPSIYDNPISKWRTIRKLKALHPTIVYPGHGSVFSGAEILKHL